MKADTVKVGVKVVVRSLKSGSQHQVYIKQRFIPCFIYTLKSLIRCETVS